MDVSHGNQAHLPALENAPRAHARFSRAQPQRRRPQSPQGAARQRPAPHRTVAANEKRFALDADRRLRSKADFERLLRRGSRRRLDGFIFYLGKRDAGPPRLGLLVTRKHARHATDRNRLKRCIREAFRLEQAQLGALDVLVQPPYGATGDAALLARLRGIFGRLTS